MWGYGADLISESYLIVAQWRPIQPWQGFIINDGKEGRTPWLMCSMFFFWASDEVLCSLLSVKWYAAGNKTAPTLRLRREEWMWVAAAESHINLSCMVTDVRIPVSNPCSEKRMPPAKKHSPRTRTKVSRPEGPISDMSRYHELEKRTKFAQHWTHNSREMRISATKQRSNLRIDWTTRSSHLRRALIYTRRIQTNSNDVGPYTYSNNDFHTEREGFNALDVKKSRQVLTNCSRDKKVQNVLSSK